MRTGVHNETPVLTATVKDAQRLKMTPAERAEAKMWAELPLQEESGMNSTERAVSSRAGDNDVDHLLDEPREDAGADNQAETVSAVSAVSTTSECRGSDREGEPATEAAKERTGEAIAAEFERVQEIVIDALGMEWEFSMGQGPEPDSDEITASILDATHNWGGTP